MRRSVTRVFSPDQGFRMTSTSTSTSRTSGHPYARRAFGVRTNSHQNELDFWDNAMNDMDRHFNFGKFGGKSDSLFQDIDDDFFGMGRGKSSTNICSPFGSKTGTGVGNIQDKIISNKGGNKIPCENAVEKKDNKYTWKIPIGENVSAENIKVGLKNGMMTINAQTQKKSPDGRSSFSQTFSKQFTVPKNADVKGVKMGLNPQGILIVEAPVKKEENRALLDPSGAYSAPMKAIKK